VTYASLVATPIAVLGGLFQSPFVDPWSSYFTGRCGVLGEVDADVIVASVFFFNPDMVHAAWAERQAAGVTPAVGAEGFRQGCFAWGRARLDGFDSAARLADLLESLADAADPTCAPIFAGWRAMARPQAGDDLARVPLAAHLLREHRMAVHAVAVRALGMRPLHAILAGEGGEGNAAFFGWPAPYPDVSHLTAARTAVEDLTNALATPVFDPLDEEDKTELLTLPTEASALARLV
jgi:hypothetical protein